MALSPTDVVNRAVYLVGNKTPDVTGTYPNFDDSPCGKAAKWLYPEAVMTVGRLFEWDFARFTAALVLSGNVAPVPWSFEYIYPAAALQIWQIIPENFDPNYPVPTSFVRANAIVNNAQVAVIHTNEANAKAVYNNNPRPDTWSPDFTDAVVRWLGSAFAMALSGRPETQQNILNSATQLLQQAMAREG